MLFSVWTSCFHLQLEENIRIVALSGDWAKLVDNGPVESFAIQSAICATGLTRKRRPSVRRGRKSSALSDVSSEDSLDSSCDFNWWRGRRGGMLSKKILQRGVLPFPVIKKASRLGSVWAPILFLGAKTTLLVLYCKHHGYWVQYVFLLLFFFFFSFGTLNSL